MLDSDRIKRDMCPKRYDLVPFFHRSEFNDTDNWLDTRYRLMDNRCGSHDRLRLDSVLRLIGRECIHHLFDRYVLKD